MPFDFNAFSLRRGNPPLIGYLPALYPNPEKYRIIVSGMAAQGLSFLEIGIPCPEPYLDGDIIRDALTKVDREYPDTLQVIRETGLLVKENGMSAIAMAYNATLESVTIKAFVKACLDGGVEGVLIPDITEKNRKELFMESQANGVVTVNFVPSGIDQKQIESIIADTNGFLYLPSSPGSTGGQFDPSGTGAGRIRFVKMLCSDKKLPVALGFGINTPIQAKQAASMGADAVIVGTALVKEATKNPETALHFLRGFFPFLEDRHGMAAVN
jgi:tryptophan synthase alpha chain